MRWFLFPFRPRPVSAPRPQGTFSPYAAAGLGGTSFGKIPASDLYEPTTADVDALSIACPGCDTSKPNWPAVQAWLIEHGTPPETDWLNLSAPAIMAMIRCPEGQPKPRPRKMLAGGSRKETRYQAPPCPRCSNDGHVTSTRPDKRRLKCGKCGHNWWAKR